MTNLYSSFNRYDILFDRDIIPCGTTLKIKVIPLIRTNKVIPLIGTLFEKFTQPWGGRILFEKMIITYLNPKIAKIKIDFNNCTASSKLSDLFKDYMRRIKYLAKSYILKKKKDIISKNNPELYPTVRSLTKTEELIEILKNEGILNKSVQSDDIADKYIGSLITLGKLLEYCEGLN